MSENTVDQAKRIIVGEYVEWIKRFDVNEYVKNRPMIEKLYEEKQLALASSLQLEEKARNYELRVHELELQNQKLLLESSEANRKASVVFTLALLSSRSK